MNDECIFIYVTTPDEIVAKNIARGLIEKKFATCVNIMSKSQTIYIWEGKIEESLERSSSFSYLEKVLFPLLCFW